MTEDGGAKVEAWMREAARQIYQSVDFCEDESRVRFEMQAVAIIASYAPAPTPAPSESADTRPAHLEVSVKDDGIWLTFNARSGKSATISVRALANAVHGPITEAALLEWCGDRSREALAPRSVPGTPLADILRRIVESANNGNELGQTWDMVAGGLIDEAEEVLKRQQ